ncbi:NAD-dependent epimerase/dehydratase family protein [Mycobacterium barrassiae]|uniref:SDR family oxidoreductase n=1 Tax=Mycobacterium barrassiae TaxID=319709 RepID=UPI0022659FDD|nr:NAD-dependent epimerase/dehydratase family protein [Mycobacterium barrassiae]MCV7301102.1 NAD-dependent epimerase/dehydratase family protein [Mycobacterium barrassiae]
MRVLVTGATGTLGRRVVPAALAAGHQVYGLSRRDRTDDTAVQWRRGDLLAGAGAQRAGVAHLVHVSIVGIDRIPLPYYQTKLRVEEVLRDCGVGHTVLRATQFHELIETIFSIQRYSPVLWAVRDIRFQPIDTRDVANRLVELIDSEPMGRVPDIGGPTVHTHAELARMYLKARGSRRKVVSVPVPGRIAAGYRAGANLAPENPVGTIGFAEYLSARQ